MALSDVVPHSPELASGAARAHPRERADRGGAGRARFGAGDLRSSMRRWARSYRGWLRSISLSVCYG
jgi:hypothetical protein